MPASRLLRLRQGNTIAPTAMFVSFAAFPGVIAAEARKLSEVSQN